MQLIDALEKIVEPTYACLLPVSRSANGTPLFSNPCPDCGVSRLSDRRKMGKPCMSCANKRRATHGLCGHPLYRLLNNMRVRCEQPTATGYAYYGGRGIRVCEEWRSDPAAFVAWAEANGYQRGLEIDRIDNDRGYEPDNCRFVTHVANSQRRRNRRGSLEQAEQVRALVAGGKSIRAAGREAGVPPMVAWHAVRSSTWAG